MNKITALKRHLMKGDSRIAKKLRAKTVLKGGDPKVTGDNSLLKRLIIYSMMTTSRDCISR